MTEPGAREERELIAEYLEARATTYQQQSREYRGVNTTEQRESSRNWLVLQEAAREIRDGAHQRSLREDD